MALEVGSRLGVFEVTGRLGEGGMGVVYRATDTSLNRDVALKVLPDAFAKDPERLARFEREAKVLASLNHPNIAQIHGLEQSGDVRALVLELVEGQTLQDRIAKGPIPLDEALPIARQIAEALEAAHEQGIIHRDLKPANVKVKSDGTVKVLDFGLAKALQPELSDTEAANSPTMTMTAAATKMGVIMGTAAYMSPEQAAGKTVDRRADIWAFGALLWEMLTGRQLFDGETVSHVLAAVLTREIAWADLPAGVPPELRRLLRRCLDRDAKRRLRDVGEARVSLDDAGASSDPASAASNIQPATPPALWQRPVPALLTVVAVAAVTGLAVWNLKPTPPQPILRFPVVLPVDQVLIGGDRHVMALSPDGSHLVYRANSQLYLRPMEESQATIMRGTQGGRGPFFSPDGQWVGFEQNGQLKKVAIMGGAPVTLCDATSFADASWGPDDTILFADFQRGIFQVSAAGGTPELLIAVEGAELIRQPQFLPDGQTVLFTVRTTGATTFDQAQVVVQSLATGERHVLVEGGTDAHYLSTGHIVYLQLGTLVAVPFDPDRLEVTGGPVSLVEGVAQFPQSGAAHFSVSGTGSLVYLPGRAGGAIGLVWVDREGIEEPIDTEALTHAHPRISPDGARVAVDVADRTSGNQDIHVYDLERHTLTRLTFDPAADHTPVWSPDGQTIVFASGRDGGGLFRKAADGTGEVEQLTSGSSTAVATSYARDGTVLVFGDTDPVTRDDLFVLPMEAGQTPQPLLHTDFDEEHAALSPDGRWIAYTSDESGDEQVYVRPFPNVDDGKWQISTDGAREPVWGADGREVFYRSADAMMAVRVETEPAFRPGAPQRLFRGSYFSGFGIQYDISPDGQQFLMLTLSGATADTDAPYRGLTQLQVVLNWFEELQARVPTGQ